MAFDEGYYDEDHVGKRHASESCDSWKQGEAMNRRKGHFNPRRKIRSQDQTSAESRAHLATTARYIGSGHHKMHPNDYGLTPPCNPRPGKTLCDEIKEFPKVQAVELLLQGIKRGMISEQLRNGWPQNIWAVSVEGEPFEAEHGTDGNYHGYPMPAEDDFRELVLEEWNSREP
ncbi:MAG TPA: hypothetical protein P5147_08825 [Myxococcota bacterium]|nr:hypothetical protein [Myxococcota bacterium]